MSLSRISVGEALAFSFVFSSRNIGSIVARIALPAVMGWGVFYISLSFYLAEFAKYLEHPSDRIGSLVLGLATGGLLVTLFLHTLIVCSVTAFAQGRMDEGWKYIHATRREWRLYAANLRCLALFGIWIVAIQMLAGTIAVRFAMPNGFTTLVDVLMIIGLVWLYIRFCFLLAPMSVSIIDGPVLRRSWRLSAGHSWGFGVIFFVLFVLAAVLEIVGEKTLRLVGIFPSLPRFGTLISYVTMYRQMLPAILIVIGLIYLISNVLLTMAKANAYAQLIKRS